MQSPKIFTLIIGSVLVAAFFMPWVTFFVSFNAWDIIFGSASQYVDTGFKYIAALIPITGILIISGAGFNNEKYAIEKDYLFKIPIISLTVLAFALLSKIDGGRGNFNNVEFDKIAKFFGIGFWLTLIASIVLPFLPSENTFTNTRLTNGNIKLSENDKNSESQTSNSESIAITTQMSNKNSPSQISMNTKNDFNQLKPDKVANYGINENIDENHKNKIETLKNLKKLLDEGILTQEEYNLEKGKLL